ncbi:T9SS type A sorting domain-containing protein [Rurimicrobium arvi]|uniref:Secretion system C-terminal sorting domain-containing protein n=1 Tax=Rurimicrobium arvi TaxID=2049916 RepID=A0ABP8MQQ8_9BACT
MKKYLLLVTLYQITIAATGQTPKHIWANSIDANSYGESLASDAHGNVYQTGVFRGAVDFDPSSAVYTMTTGDSLDIFIAKTDPDGNFLWSQQFGVAAKNDIGNSVTTDHKDRICVTGAFNDTVDFDAGPLVRELKSGWAGRSAFVLQLDSNGAFNWARTFFGNITTRTIGTDADNNIYVIGQYRDSVSFDPYGPGARFSGSGNFLLKLREDGSFIWVKRIGALSAASLLSFAVNKYGEVYCCGVFSETTDLDPDAGVFTVSGSGVFVVKLDDKGAYSWVKQIDRSGAASLVVWSVGLDAAGNLYGTGQFADSIDFDPSPAVSALKTASYKSADACVFKWDSSGNFLWVRGAGGTAVSNLSMAVDSLGNSHVQGSYSGSVNFDPPGTTYLFSSPGTSDIFVASFDPNGKTKWAKSMGGYSDDFAGTIIVGPGNTLYNSGNFINDIFFDTSVLSSGTSISGFFLQKMQFIPLEIREQPKGRLFSLQPNPATDVVTITLNCTAGQNYTVMVYDITGRLVLNNDCVQVLTQLDLRSLLPGNYLVCVRDEVQSLGAMMLQKQ